jgi:hypothetical protein
MVKITRRHQLRKDLATEVYTDLQIEGLSAMLSDSRGWIQSATHPHILTKGEYEIVMREIVPENKPSIVAEQLDIRV